MNRIPSESIRRYFKRKSSRFSVMLMIVGLIIMLGGFAFSQDRRQREAGNLFLLVGVIIFLISIIKLFVGKKSAVSDEQIDDQFQKDLKSISKIAMNKLGLDESESTKGRKDPLILKGPILWSTTGIDNKDLMWKKGKDGVVRFSINRVTIIYFSEHRLAAYACDYNFIKDVALNESTNEYYYKDIVSVSTNEISTSYVLPNGVKLKRSQEFRLSVTNGEAITVFVDSGRLSKMTDGNIPTEDAERAVKVVRSILRDRKE